MVFTKAKDLYERGCHEYLKLFCKKHGFDYDDARQSWVGGNIGDVVMCADYYVSMETIKVDIDEGAPEEEFLRHYDYCMDAQEFDLPIPNFRSWLMGCPRTSPEIFDKLRTIKASLEFAIEEERERCTIPKNVTTFPDKV